MSLLRSLTLFIGVFLVALHANAQVPEKVYGTLPALPGTLSTTSLPASVISNTPVGTGDILRVTVYGQPDLSTEVGVNDQGMINLPLIGTLKVTGLRTSEIAKQVEQAYRDKKFLVNPEVSVEATQVRSQLVSILGDVYQPGRYVIPGHLSLLELLATAGGLQPSAAPYAIVLRKDVSDPSKTTETHIPLSDPASGSFSPKDMALANGDVVYVERKKLFYIHGEVNRPGEYPIEPEMNVMRAISIGGGMNQRASTWRISIYRTTNGKSENISAKLNTPVKAGDVINIKESIF